MRVTSRARRNSFKSLLTSRLSLPAVEGRSASFENIRSSVAREEEEGDESRGLSASLSSSGLLSDKDESQLPKRKLSARLLSFFRRNARQSRSEMGKFMKLSRAMSIFQSTVWLGA